MSPINKDQSDLANGLEPDLEPRFIGVLLDEWHDNRDDYLAHAIDGTLFRHSNAGKCARLVGYNAAGIAQTDPMDRTGTWNVTMGSDMHDKWQAALLRKFPDAEIEVKVATQGADGSGHIDAVIRHDNKTVAYELKTVGGYAYKAAIGVMRQGTPAEGPKPEHITQAALNGLAVDADEIVVGYLAKEAVSVNVGRDLPSDLHRVNAEWTFTREQYEPIAVDEAKRVNGILRLVTEQGELPKRRFAPTQLGTTPEGGFRLLYATEGRDPVKGHEIVDPTTGKWEVTDDEGVVLDTGSWWACNYCSHQTLCAGTEPGRIPVEIAVKAREELD